MRIAAAIILLMPLALFAGDPDSILGIWQNSDKSVLIKIYKENNRYHGSIIKMCSTDKDASKQLDVNNPDKSLQKRKLVGLVILKDLIFDGDSTWEEGSIYDPNNGKTYRTKVTLSDDGDTLELRGFIGLSLFGRTEEWTCFKGKLK